MYKKIAAPFLFLTVIILIVALACSIPGGSPDSPPATQTPQPEQPEQQQPSPTPLQPTATIFSGESNLPEIPTATSTPVVIHTDFPSNTVEMGKIIYDAESSGTAEDKRAPYGDSYDAYRMERPFTQDMTYIPDMDIVTYNFNVTDDWVYVSIELIGSNPNNEIGIHYAVELDVDSDGFGDYIIWSNPPYSPEWTTEGVQVFEDQNHDTGGLSAELSDAPFDGDGYETEIFDSGFGEDPDLAWIRTNAARQATVQFAFKKSLAGPFFMLGVLTDAGLKDVNKMFYNDRFRESEAGSPEKSEKYYPLNGLYGFDNVCREVFGFKPTGYEPQLCPRVEPTPAP